MARPTEIPPFAHAVERGPDGVWRCAGRATFAARSERCAFSTDDMSEAVAHAASRQYDWRHAPPVDASPGDA